MNHHKALVFSAAKKFSTIGAFSGFKSEQIFVAIKYFRCNISSLVGASVLGNFDLGNYLPSFVNHCEFAHDAKESRVSLHGRETCTILRALESG